MSFEFWLKFENGATDRDPIFTRGTSGTGIRIYRDAAGRITFDSETPSTRATVRSPVPLELDIWHHVAAVLSIDNGLRLFIDGFEFANFYDQPVFPIASSGATNVVGATGSGADDTSDVLVDDIRIYEGELETGDIRGHFLQSDLEYDETYLLTRPGLEDLADDDSDGINNLDDNCPTVSNSGQVDTDDDGIGDACQDLPDDDEDGIPDAEDNCVLAYNPSQTDTDDDGIGDACETDLGSDE